MPAFTCDDCIKTACVFRREAFWCKSIEVASDNLKETKSGKSDNLCVVAAECSNVEESQ